MVNSVLRGVIRGVISNVFGGDGGVKPVCWPEPIAPCSTETERYLWLMDGQDDFWLRAETWQCVDPVIEMSFIGYTPTTTYILFDGDTSGTDRAFAFINANTGYVNCPSAQTLELNGVVVSPNTATAKPVEGEENHIKITFTGNFRVGVVGCRFSRDLAFSSTPITAIKLTDPADAANTHTTKFVNNEAYQLELGGELGPELWAGQNYSSANNAVVTTLVSGSQWSVQTTGSTAPNNVGVGARVNDFSTVVGQTYEYSVGSTVAVNLAAYDSTFSLIASTTDGDELIFTATGTTTRLYVCPKTNDLVTFGPSSVKAIPASTFLRENEEPDGSDIVDITRKPDNSGWTGDGLDYDYATGARRDLGAYSAEYSAEYGA